MHTLGIAAFATSFSSLPPFRQAGARLRARCRFVVMTATPPGQATLPVLYVKAAEDGKSLGDCPFSMKANLAIRLKSCPVDVQTIDLSDKPDWFLELNPAGTTPTFVALDGEVIDSSDEVVAWADETGPNKDIRLYREDSPFWSSAMACTGPVFGAFVQLIKNKDPSLDSSLRAALLEALTAVDAEIKKSGGPFLLGHLPSALDCNLGPKLHHVQVAGKHYKAFDFPQHLGALNEYMRIWMERPEWMQTSCADETVIWGWSKFFK